MTIAVRLRGLRKNRPFLLLAPIVISVVIFAVLLLFAKNYERSPFLYSFF
jgi:hypothetical protein